MNQKKKFSLAILAVLIILIIIEALFVHPHAYSIWHEIHGFDAILGFFVSILLILVARPFLNLFIRRTEDYYDKREDKNGTNTASIKEETPHD